MWATWKLGCSTFEAMEIVKEQRELTNIVASYIERLQAERFSMGNFLFSSQHPPQTPPGIKQLNESVWEFYTPSTVPEVEIVLFHGLQLTNYEEAFWKTWLSRDGTIVWPKDWLSEHLPKARIISISYDSCARAHSGEKDLHITTENLISDMIFVGNLGQNCPVVLVGHSLGGLIIKKLLVVCNDMKGLMNSATSQYEVHRIEKFLSNCKGVFYYSTPHTGSRIADFADRIPFKKSPLIDLLKTLSKETARINSNFSSVRANLGITTRAVVEGLDTEYMGLKGRVVDEASARNDIDGVLYTVRADHYDVCRPINNKNCNIFTSLRDFIANTILKGNASVVLTD